MTGITQLSVAEVKARLERGDTFRLIDVREPNEHAVAAIEGAELLPLSQAQQWLTTLDSSEDLVFFCHAGFRSMQVAQYLVQQCQFQHVSNMIGGIDAWSLEIDPHVPRY